MRIGLYRRSLEPAYQEIEDTPSLKKLLLENRRLCGGMQRSDSFDLMPRGLAEPRDGDRQASEPLKMCAMLTLASGVHSSPGSSPLAL
jgi:hypothetical protein